MMRTSTFWVSTEPTRMNSFSWMTRRSLAWVSMVTVPISSKKIEPPSAASKSPFLLAIAPVNAPLTCPKRLDSSSSAGIEPELTVMKGAPERGECVWMARATSSLPVPLSPSTRIVERDGPARRTSSNTLRIPADLPTIRPRPKRSESSSRRRRFSSVRRRASEPLRRVRSTSSFWKGFGM